MASSAEISNPLEACRIGAVVRDLDSTLASCRDCFDLGPWSVAEVASAKSSLRGSPSSFRARVASTMLGPVALEIVQPVDGLSLYHEHLTTKGEGLQHVALLADRFDDQVAVLGQRGAVALESGTTTTGERFATFDAGGGILFKLVDRLSSNHAVLPQAGGFGVGNVSVCQVGVVVDALVPAVERLTNVFGVRHWLHRSHDASPITVRGEERVFNARNAHAQLGRLQLELINPLDSGAVHYEYLAANRIGLHHLGFIVPNVKQRVEERVPRGAQVLQCHASPYGLRYAYLQQPGNELIFELLEDRPSMWEFFESVKQLGKGQ